MQRLIRFLSTTALAAVALLMGTTDAVAQQIPQYLSYQGVLTNDSREAVQDGSYSMTFRLYAEASGGTALWQESQTVLTQDGVFDAYLGLINPLSIPFDAQYWISAEVAGQPEMTPRTRLVPAPYSLISSRAILADDVEGGVVRSLNGQQGDVTIVGGVGTTVTNTGSEITISATGQDLSLTEGSIFAGDAANTPAEVAIGQPGQVLNVNEAGNQPEWTSDLNIGSITVRRVDADSLFVNKYANFGGTTDFHDTVNFFGPVNFLFPTTNDLSYQSLVVGNTNDKMSELASTGVEGAILMQDADGNPGWSSDLNVRNVTINGTQTTINSTTITVGPANSTTTFEGDVIFNKTPKIALAHNNIWVGDATGFQTPLAPGTTGNILMIDEFGAPRWNLNPGGLLPAGTTNGATLRWDGTQWVENTGLTSDEFGNTSINGVLSVAGPEVYLPNGSVQNHELASSTINVTYGPGLSGGSSVQLGSTLTIENTGVVEVKGTPNQVSASTAGTTVTLSTPQDIHTDATPEFDGLTLDNLTPLSTATNVLVTTPTGVVETRTAASLVDLNDLDLSENAVLVGDNTDKASELASTNVEGAVLQLDNNGAPVWDNNLNVNDITIEGDQINNGDVTFNGPNFTTSNTTTSTFNGPTNLDGSTTNINSPTINIGGPTTTDITIGNTTSTTTFEGDIIFNNLPDLPLGEGEILVGNAGGVAAPYAPGTDGQALRISGGIPTWQSVLELPTGTTNNATLVWNGTEWVENTKVTMDPASGDINTEGDVNIEGDLNVEGEFQGAGPNNFAGSVAIPLNAVKVDIPYPAIKTGASINVTVTDPSVAIGIVPVRIVSVNPGVGFTIELAITYDSPTGTINYVVVNP